jgi:hypothetical protein
MTLYIEKIFILIVNISLKLVTLINTHNSFKLKEARRSPAKTDEEKKK